MSEHRRNDERDGFVVIDGNELSFQTGENLVQAAARAGIEIPTLCWDPRLTPAGACRMCLVEIDGASRLAPACATRCAPGMVVRTDTPKVARNRRFILSIHAADAPAALDRDDSGPSRLPELIDRYGTAGDLPATLSPRAARPGDDNRFIEFRADRCIACSQCTRYCDEIEAVSAITMAGRGAATTVATADAKGLLDTTCELCGGCVAVCPTGAMADRPALEHGKSERELAAVRTTCNFCGVGCQLDLWVDREANRIVKATPPAPGTTVNDGSLCVKGRFANDFVHHRDRLTTPLVRDRETGELAPASWDEALERAAAGLRGVAERHGPDALGFVSSSRCTVEENYLVQKMARAVFGTHNVHQCAAT
jgi:predicted molibdopterin-dependent oxidoreductase YjgC